MKTTAKLLALFGMLFLLFQSCKKKKEDTGSNFSQEIKNIVPDSLIAKFESAGIEIHEGKNPPTINGIYQGNPMTTVYDNSGTAGSTISDYRYKFYDQNTTDLTIKLDYKSMSVFSPDVATGAGAYLSGTNNKFSAFVLSNGQTRGINYQVLSIFSGEITAEGVKDFRHAVYVKSKGDDPNNYLSPVGTLRIYKDGNGLAEVRTTY